MSIIELKNISQNFDKLSVIESLNLNLEKGEVLGLFGHNGAGKTTTMKIILGLLEPSNGQVKVFGENPFHSDFSHHRYRIGFLPENVSFYQQLTGLEVLQFFAKLKKVSVSRCLDLLEKVGLSEASTRKVKTYSKGMKQRLGLAQAILTEPSLLLLDEPTVGLDPIAIQEFYTLVDNLKEKGCSIILCSHVLPGVEKHIDKVAILSKGQLAAYGSIKDLRNQTSLPTKINFSGCFNIDELTQKLNNPITSNDSGTFSLEIDNKDKLPVVKILLAQPGIQDLDTLPPSLEQLYYHFVITNQTSPPAIIKNISGQNDIPIVQPKTTKIRQGEKP